MRVLIKNCTLIDGVGDEALPGRSVLVEDDKIVQIAQGAVSAPADLEVDGTGKYLLPGLMNLHVHINRRHASRSTRV